MPVEGVWSAMDMLRRREGTPALHVAQLRAVTGGEEWLRLEEWERAAITEWALKHAPRFRGGVSAALGTVDRDGHHHAAPPAELPETPLPATFAVMPDEAHAKAIAHDVWYAGRLGLIHGPAGGGKSTLMALAAAAVTRGELFAGRSTTAGTVLVCTEDAATWREVMAGRWCRPCARLRVPLGRPGAARAGGAARLRCRGHDAVHRARGGLWRARQRERRRFDSQAAPGVDPRYRRRHHHRGP